MSQILYKLSRKNLRILAIPIIRETNTRWFVGKHVAVGGYIAKPKVDQPSHNIYYTSLDEAIKELLPLLLTESVRLGKRLERIRVGADAIQDGKTELYEVIGIVRKIPEKPPTRPANRSWKPPVPIIDPDDED